MVCYLHTTKFQYQLDNFLGYYAIQFCRQASVCMYLTSKSDGITSQKTVILLILTTMRTSDLAQ